MLRLRPRDRHPGGCSSTSEPRPILSRARLWRRTRRCRSRRPDGCRWSGESLGFVDARPHRGRPRPPPRSAKRHADNDRRGALAARHGRGDGLPPRADAGCAQRGASAQGQGSSVSPSGTSSTVRRGWRRTRSRCTRSSGLPASRLIRLLRLPQHRSSTTQVKTEGGDGPPARRPPTLATRGVETSARPVALRSD